MIAKGIAKKIAIAKESAWGTLAGPSGARYLRRVTADFNLAKESYTSNEILTSRQVSDMRHGIRSVEGNLNAELSPGSYSDLMGSAISKDFAAVTALSGVEVTIAASGDLFTVTRSAGSFITDGVRVGHVLALTGAGLNAANAGNNLLVVTLAATVATVKVLSSVALVAEGPITPVGVTIRGKTTYAPLTAHTDDSYTVEEWYSDIAQSEVYSGVKVGSMAVQLPTTGMVTCDFGMMGKDLAQTGTTQYFTTPTASNNEGIFASVSGALVVNGVPTGLVTALDFTLERNLEAANAVGSNTSADMFQGKIAVSGNFSTYFQDGVFRGYFKDEDEISIIVALTTGDEKDADVMSFTMPRVKVGSAGKQDAELGIISSHTFTALLNSNTAGGLEETTLMIQDSTLV